MDHRVDAKVIFTLLDLYYLCNFFSFSMHFTKNTTMKTDAHTHTHTFFASDEQAASSGVRRAN